jgi:hypothetical protein
MEVNANIIPKNYNLYFNINISELKLYGETTIQVDIDKKIDHIILNSKDLIITELLVDNKKYNFKEDVKEEILIIKGSFDIGTHSIYIKYTHIISVDMDGLYYVKQDESIIFSTQLEPIYARRVFPCFDVPNLKSKFIITIESDKDKTFLSNMPEKNTKIVGNNKIVNFFETPLMSTYLVCIVIGDLKKGKSCIVRDDLVVNGYYFNKSENLLNVSIKTTRDSVKYFEKLFDINYKLPKLDIIAIPNFLAGAMENWGLITFRESGLMVDNTENISSLINSIEVIYHEISHQWFGNLVTLNSWENIWLNEATATYFSWLGLIDNYKYLHPKQWYYLNTYRSAMLMDGFESTHPISTEIKSSNDVIQFFDEISYSKGSCLINYLSEFMGKTKFMLGISDYLKKYSWSTAEPKDLYSILEVHSNNTKYSISNLIKDFIFVKGYPLITVRKDDNKYIITKTKFSFVKNNKLKEEFNLKFPLKIKVLKNKQIFSEIIDFEDEIILNDEPIINEDNMMLCIIDYNNYTPNIKFMNMQELMHHFDSVYYLAISSYKSLNTIIELVNDIFNTIDFINNLNISMCLFQLITKSLIALYYKLKSSGVKSIFKDKYNKFINNIKLKIIKILTCIINNKQKDIIMTSWLIDLLDFIIEVGDVNTSKLLNKTFNILYNLNEPAKFIKFPLHEVLFKYMIKYNDSPDIRNKIIKIKNNTPDIFIRNSAMWAITNSQDVEFLNFLMNNVFSFVKLQDISTFIFYLSKNLLIQQKVIDWIFATVKSNQNITYKNFACIIERVTPNIYNLELLEKLKKLYEQENDSSIFAIENDKINWNISVVKNFITYL